MANIKDTIRYQGEDYEIEHGVTADDVRSSMTQVFSSVINANIERSANEDGSNTWLITERGGDKG